MLEKKNTVLLRGPYDIYYVSYISIKTQNKALNIYVATKYTFYNDKQVKKSSSKKLEKKKNLRGPYDIWCIPVKIMDIRA